MRSRKDVLVVEKFQVCYLDFVLFENPFQRFGEIGVEQGYAVKRLSDGGLSW